MIMAATREARTAGRIDDLNRKVDEGSRRLDARFDAAEGHVDRRFEGIEARLYALQRLMTQLWGLMLAALIALVATQL
jgi:hypothetical protein